MDRSYSACTATACALVEILNKLRDTPKQNSARHNCHTLSAKPIKAKTILKNKPPTNMIRRLLYLLNSCPVTGKVTSKPIGMANNIPPNCASFKCSLLCIVGIRDAQVAYPNPDRKKKTAFAIRNCWGVRGVAILADVIKLQIYLQIKCVRS
jgi:hypothetical protein